jgi:P27 family predicted phage terminase small subunit
MANVRRMPLELQAAKGSWRVPLADKTVAATSTGSIGDPPDDMNDLAKLHWQQCANDWQLTLRPAHRDALRMYCEAWAVMQHALTKLDEDNLVYTTSKGDQAVNQYYRIVCQQRDFLRRMIGEFGSSPGASARVVVPANNQDDEFFN